MDNHVLYAWSSINDKSDLCINFTCPQATYVLPNKWKKTSVLHVCLLGFPLLELCDKLMPFGYMRSDIDFQSVIEADNAAVYFGMSRYLKKIGPLPLLIKCNLPLNTWWEDAIADIIWPDVTFLTLKGEEAYNWEHSGRRLDITLDEEDEIACNAREGHPGAF